VPNFVKIGQSVAKILRFFNFSIWRAPPSAAILYFRNREFFKCITAANFVKIGRHAADVLHFFGIFKMTAAAILDF